MRASQPGALVKPTSRLEWNILISNWTNLKRNSNTYRMNIIVSFTFFWANQLVNILIFQDTGYAHRFFFKDSNYHSVICKLAIGPFQLTFILTSWYKWHLNSISVKVLISVNIMV